MLVISFLPVAMMNLSPDHDELIQSSLDICLGSERVTNGPQRKKKKKIGENRKQNLVILLTRDVAGIGHLI